MIPADHISFNNDDTAWLVMPADPITDGRPDVWVDRDRPCATCVSWGGRWASFQNCRDCDGTGRHTFTVEVEWEDGQRTPPQHLRVSVAPGMVLPITSEVTDNASVQIAPDGTAFLLDAYTPGQPWTGGSRIIIPPAAEPGMFAVKLEVHR